MKLTENKIIFGRQLSNDTSSYYGAQIGIGKLNKSQVTELLSYLENKDYSNKYLKNFQEYSELFHYTGIPFSSEFNTLEDLTDEDMKSIPDNIEFELDEDGEIVKKEQHSFSFKLKGFYLISIRFEDIYIIRSASLANNSEIKITAGIDTLPVLGTLIVGDPDFYILNNFWIKAKKMDFSDEEGNGDIYSTYQILYYYDGRKLKFEDACSRDEMLEILGADNYIMYSDRTSEPPDIVTETEDFCPFLIEEDEVEEGTLSMKIEILKELL